MTDADELPSVPDDAPPAILFRLSYRANENHRSGYRPTAKSSGAARVPKYVEEAWISQGGRRVPASMRDKIDALQASQDVREMQMLLAGLLASALLLGRGRRFRVCRADRSTGSAADAFCAYHHCGCGSRETTRAVPVSENHASSRRPFEAAERQSTPLSPAS